MFHPCNYSALVICYFQTGHLHGDRVLWESLFSQGARLHVLSSTVPVCSNYTAFLTLSQLHCWGNGLSCFSVGNYLQRLWCAASPDIFWFISVSQQRKRAGGKEGSRASVASWISAGTLNCLVCDSGKSRKGQQCSSSPQVSVSCSGGTGDMWRPKS